MLASTTFAVDDDVVIRLVAASVLGALIGIEREASDQPAGLRTHIAVALGAGLFGVISTLGFVEFDEPRADSTLQADVTRVASNVVVGIGFLGAGVIFRQGSTIRNLTTAASLWTVAAIGLACGVGDVTTAAIATGILLLGLVLLRPIRNFISTRWATGTSTVRVELAPGVEPAALVRHLPSDDTVEAEQFTVLKEDGHLVLVSEISGRPAELRAWVSQLAESAEVD